MDNATRTKSDVTCTNTGNVTVYLRAAYTLGWYQGGKAVAAFQDDEKAYFTGLGGSDGESNTWLLGDDGYYYYKYPVAPGKTTTYPLFEKFVAPAAKDATGAPANAHLEMNVLLQGVQFDAAKTGVTKAWAGVKYVGADGTVTSDDIVGKLATEVEATK